MCTYNGHANYLTFAVSSTLANNEKLYNSVKGYVYLNSGKEFNTKLNLTVEYIKSLVKNNIYFSPTPLGEGIKEAVFNEVDFVEIASEYVCE